jgi:hypothetical protein
MMVRRERTMNRSVSDYCNEQAQRMKTLAKESKDRDVRAHLTRMAENWERRAKANESAKAPEKRAPSSLPRKQRQKGGLDSVQTAKP